MNWLDYIWAHKDWLFSGLGIALVGLAFKIVKNYWPKKMPISYSYTRAFGALQVPQFLRGMYAEYPNGVMQFLPTETITQFWEGWPHKYCKLIETQPYRELYNQDLGFFLAAMELLKTVALEDPVSADFYNTTIDYDLIEKTYPDME